MTIGYLIMEADSLISLCFGTIKAKRIGKLIKRISHLNGSVGEMRSIHKQIQYALLFLLTCYLISMSSYLYVAYIRLEEFSATITWFNFIGNSPSPLTT